MPPFMSRMADAVGWVTNDCSGGRDERGVLALPSDNVCVPGNHSGVKEVVPDWCRWRLSTWSTVNVARLSLTLIGGTVRVALKERSRLMALRTREFNWNTFLPVRSWYCACKRTGMLPISAMMVGAGAFRATLCFTRHAFTCMKGSRVSRVASAQLALIVDHFLHSHVLDIMETNLPPRSCSQPSSCNTCRMSPAH